MNKLRKRVKLMYMQVFRTYLFSGRTILLGLIAVGLYSFSIQSSLAKDTTYILTAQQWNIPRSATSVLSMPALQDAMKEFHSGKSTSLLVKYPGGDEGTLWAYELRGWLISLGVASDRIELSPGSAKSTQLELSVVHTR